MNNAGKANLKRILEADPSILQWMLRLNHNSIALLTHHALKKWREEPEDQQRYGLIQLSSSVGEIHIPRIATYCATKRFDLVYSRMIDDRVKQASLPVDTLIVKPFSVTT